MRAIELTINGTDYQYRQQYLKDDELWECTFVDVHGNIAEAASGNLVNYNESLGQDKKELEALVNDNEIEPDVDNEVIIWKCLDAETQRKIKVKAHTLKNGYVGRMGYRREYINAKWCKSMRKIAALGSRKANLIECKKYNTNIFYYDYY